MAISTEKDNIDKMKMIFTFEDFKLKSVCIPKVFNNFYKDENDYNYILNKLICEALPMFSNETRHSLLLDDKSKGKKLHFHQIKGKELEIIEKILLEYDFPKDKIDYMLYSGEIYQLSFESGKTATRIIAEREQNIYKLLFIDVNHHIYLNNNFTDTNQSLFYEICPKYETKKCENMIYSDLCYAFDYLDKEKLTKSFGFSFENND